MNKKGNRRKEIIKLLQLRNGVTIKELASLFNVSEMTIRRDLTVLESENIVNLVHGAAIYNPQIDSGKMVKVYNLATAKSKNNEAKNRIGKFAAGLIGSDDYVIIDSGSTTERVIPSVALDKKFTLMCYGSNIMMSAISKPNIKLVMGGGDYHPDTMVFESKQNEDYVAGIRANKCFMSAAGIDEKFGVTCMNTYETGLKKAVMESSMEKILLCDSSKFGKVTPAHFAEITDFNMIITDKDLSEEWQEKIKDLDIELVMV